ncbi:MAG: 2-hydroxychromene-2-carboxylate isomerase [Pseudomonadota bacterium]|nr:2-hydroxychromene-2-carboxylate isomerase [Pseudomonadota bacterium]
MSLWFDYSCPYAYLASTQVEALCARAGANLVWKPMLLGGVFAAHATPQNLAGTLSPAKARHMHADLARWADLFGIPLVMPFEHPRRTVSALRATLAHACDPAIIHAFYRAYWVDGRAIEDDAVVREIAGKVDLSAHREDLRARTDAAIALGIFGAPTFQVGDNLWWGQDRMALVEHHLVATNPVERALPS